MDEVSESARGSTETMVVEDFPKNHDDSHYAAINVFDVKKIEFWC